MSNGDLEPAPPVNILAKVGAKDFEILTNLTTPDDVATKSYADLTELCKCCNYGDQLSEAPKETFLGGLNNKFIKMKVMADCAGKIARRP